MAAIGGGGGGGGAGREGGAKAAVAEQIAQAVQSTSNLLRLMQDDSPAQAQLTKLSKRLVAKSSTVKNTGQVLEQLPRVISSLDAYTGSSLDSAPYLKTVTQLLSHMESCQLKSSFPAFQHAEKHLNPGPCKKGQSIKQVTKVVRMTDLEETPFLTSEVESFCLFL